MFLRLDLPALAVLVVAGALAALAFAPPSRAGDDEPSIMPETPDGWRYERMTFPLDFAPELRYEGFEELRFAPGMFDAKSETFWTYCFAIQLEGEVTVDQAFVEEFLLVYYRGLCVEVGKSNGKPVAKDAIKVAVAPRKGERDPFVAKLDIVDAFVTGKPLVLTVELTVAPTPKGGPTRLFAIASPRPDGDPVWKTLREIRDRFPKKAGG